MTNKSQCFQVTRALDAKTDTHSNAHRNPITGTYPRTWDRPPALA